MKKVVIFFFAAVLTQAVFGKTVGIYRANRRDLVTPGLLRTIQDARWTQVDFAPRDLVDTNKLAAAHVLLFTGGWNDYFFPSDEARRALHGFVADGKGILSSGFRSGYCRTANRPLFPQVGATHNRGNGSILVGTGDSVLAKAIAEPFSAGGWDHMTLAVGAEGNVFATCAGDPVGAYGEIYGGRYIALGAFIGASAPSSGMERVERDAFLAMLDWLSAAPRRSAAEVAKARAQAELDFLRREKRWDWTLDSRGPDRNPGIVPSARHRIAGILESRLYRLDYQCAFLGRAPGSAQAAMAELRTALAELDAKTKARTAAVLARIDGMTAQALDGWKTDRAAQIPKTEAELLPAERLTALRAQADQLIGQRQPRVDAIKAERLARERKADAARVPELAKALADGEVAARRDAVAELGRIGHATGGPALIAALNDSDQTVRVNAILGLGWMQAREAVPPLIEMAKGTDARMTRRAVQALGQIGDARAIPVLLPLVRDADLFTADNAILALGWLKAREAVPELVRIATTLNRDNGNERGMMLAAVRALGAIGDETAIPALEKVAQDRDDFPRSRRGARLISNIYSTAQSIGFKRHAEMAIADIRDAAKRARPAGVAQPAFLAASNRFYALTKRFNALAGRPTTGTNLFKDDPLAYLAYLKEAGMTGVHMAWGYQDADPDAYLKLIQACNDLDLIVVDTWPFDGNMFGSKWMVSAPRQSSLEKAAGDLLAERYRNEPAFAGLWSEEIYPHPEISMAEFEAWYSAAYQAAPREQFGYTDEKGFAEKAKTFGAEMAECRAHKNLVFWRESQEWMHGLRKGCALTFSISHRSIADHAGMTALAGDALHVNGPEAYQCFGRDNAFLMEMHKDGRARPVMCEFYNWYTPSPAHAVRGFAQHLMHGECFYNFHLAHIFKYAGGGYNWTWGPDRWEHARRIFRKARKIRQYLAVPESGANVAQLCSDRTATQYLHKSCPPGFRWYQHQAALWTALQQSQIPADVIWAESLSAEKLARYRVIVTVDSKLLNDRQAALLRDWVKKGGVLIAGGTVSLFDQADQARGNYLLADVFGVSHAGFMGVTDPARNDTLMFERGKPPLPLVSTMMRPTVLNHVHRETKPEKSVGVYTVQANAALPGMAVGAACEYDMPLGYDRVTPTAGTEVLAAFADGDPAVTLARFGAGACYFWTPIYPALCYVGSEYENDANKKDFWPNVREILAAMVRGGLARQGATLPVDVTGVSKEVEVTVREQPERHRTMVHLLDYDTGRELVKNATIVIHPPGDRTAQRVFYPDTHTALPFTVTPAGLTASLRDFSVHDMLVIEWSR